MKSSLTKNIRPVRTVSSIKIKTEAGSSLQVIKNLLCTLSSSELEEALNHLLLLRKDKQPTTELQRKLLMWQDSLNTELGHVLGQRERMFPQPMVPKSKKLLKDVEEFLEVAGLASLRTEETKRIYNLLAKILVNHAAAISSRIKIPLSMRLVLQTTTSLVALFDNHFPNYVKSGLVGKILIQAHAGITVDTEKD